MLQKNLLKSATLTAAVICMLLFASCGSDPAKVSTEPSSSQTGAAAENTPPAPAASSPDPETTDVSPVPSTNPEPADASPAPASEESEPSAAPSETPGNGIAKINGGADEVGIYSIVLRLTDQAADKGVVEMVYYGSKGSPQENSIVNTFRIEYNKESAGTFEIQTFFDGEVYQNLHHKDEVKVVNTFDAALRAGSVIISYTPDGGDTQEIFSADAEYFYVPTD